MILSTRDTDFNWQNFLKEMRDLTEEERKEFVVDRNLIEPKPRDPFGNPALISAATSDCWESSNDTVDSALKARQ